MEHPLLKANPSGGSTFDAGAPCTDINDAHSTDFLIKITVDFRAVLDNRTTPGRETYRIRLPVLLDKRGRISHDLLLKYVCANVEGFPPFNRFLVLRNDEAKNIHVSYNDAENDTIVISNTESLTDAINQFS